MEEKLYVFKYDESLIQIRARRLGARWLGVSFGLGNSQLRKNPRTGTIRGKLLRHLQAHILLFEQAWQVKPSDSKRSRQHAFQEAVWCLDWEDERDCRRGKGDRTAFWRSSTAASAQPAASSSASDISGSSNGASSSSGAITDQSSKPSAHSVSDRELASKIAGDHVSGFRNLYPSQSKQTSGDAVGPQAKVREQSKAPAPPAPENVKKE